MGRANHTADIFFLILSKCKLIIKLSKDIHGSLVVLQLDVDQRLKALDGLGLKKNIREYIPFHSGLRVE